VVLGSRAASTLLVFVDDATIRLMHLKFARERSTSRISMRQRALFGGLGKAGSPSIVAKHGVFRVNHQEGASAVTADQFGRGRAPRRTHIEIICAIQSGEGPVRASVTDVAAAWSRVAARRCVRLAGGTPSSPHFTFNRGARGGITITMRALPAPANAKDLHRLRWDDIWRTLLSWKEERTPSPQALTFLTTM